MPRFESFLTKIQNLNKDYCEFRDNCPYFDPDSHTYTKGGGLYCGKYRKFEAEKKPKKIGLH